MKKYFIFLLLILSYFFVYSVGAFNGYKLSLYTFIPEYIHKNIKILKEIDKYEKYNPLIENIYENIYINMLTYKNIMSTNSFLYSLHSGYSLYFEIFKLENRYKKDFSLYCSSIYIRENSKNSTHTDLANSYIEIFENETR